MMVNNSLSKANEGRELVEVTGKDGFLSKLSNWIMWELSGTNLFTMNYRVTEGIGRNEFSKVSQIIKVGSSLSPVS